MTIDKHTKCWCEYPADDCGNHGCPDYEHREFVIVAVHHDDNYKGFPVELWAESDGEIKFCPVCGDKLKKK